MKNNYLLDKDFLKQVDEYYQREVYAKIVSLDLDENPIAEIQGNVTQGTININGDSAVRRTCNLTLVTSSINVNEIDWALRTKFRVYMGLKNFVDPERYDDILWFKQGTFIITSFTSQLNGQGYTISIQGKDKMCLLNGDIGGNLFAAHDFGKLYTLEDDGTTTIDDIPIYDIIREALHVYALEPYSNIVINDLENCAVELLDFKAKGTTLYIVDELLSDGTTSTGMYFSASELGSVIETNGLVDNEQFEYANARWQIKKIVHYGDTVGYRLTDLTYVGDLIAQVGGTITQILDLIVKMLGEFEYYYDVDGKFIFQRKRVHFNIPWTSIVKNEDETYVENAALTSANVYEFNRGLLIESFQNKPLVNNIKNDYAVWGKMQGTTTEIPIHLRYAIDTKPKYYYSHSQKKVFASTEVGGPYDWRELIYQMAKDNNKYRGQMDMKLSDVEDALTTLQQQSAIAQLVKAEELYNATWNTGYDAYYADMLSFWRDIYNCDGIKTTVNADGLREDDMTAEQWNAFVNNKYWNPQYFDLLRSGEEQFRNPHTLPFWIDFLDDTSEFGQYSVSMIGRRPKVINDADVKAIFFRETPDILFISANDDSEHDVNALSYTRMNIPPSFESYFTMSSQGKSAKDTLDNLVYQHTFYQESISVSAVPIYYLEPNTRISIHDETSGIAGEYLIKTISLSLAHDGMMTITATKAVDRIL